MILSHGRELCERQNYVLETTNIDGAASACGVVAGGRFVNRIVIIYMCVCECVCCVPIQR